MNKIKVACWKKFSIKFLTRICQYNIKNEYGNSHIIANTFDFIMLLIYLALTITIITKNQFSGLSYGIILVSTIRTMLKHSKKIIPSNVESNCCEKRKPLLCITELVLTTIFSFSAVIYSVLFFTIEDYTQTWVIILFTVYYLINFMLDLLDILINLFDAEAKMFSYVGGDKNE